MVENFLTRNAKVEKMVVCLGWLTQSCLLAVDKERFPVTVEDVLWRVVPNRDSCSMPEVLGAGAAETRLSGSSVDGIKYPGH